MAETTRIDEMQSNIADFTAGRGERISRAAQDVAATMRDNRPLMYVGIGLLAVAAGFGIWALVRQFRYSSTEPGLETSGVETTTEF